MSVDSEIVRGNLQIKFKFRDNKQRRLLPFIEYRVPKLLRIEPGNLSCRGLFFSSSLVILPGFISV